MVDDAAPLALVREVAIAVVFVGVPECASFNSESEDGAIWRVVTVPIGVLVPAKVIVCGVEISEFISTSDLCVPDLKQYA